MPKFYAAQSPQGFADKMRVHSFTSLTQRNAWVAARENGSEVWIIRKTLFGGWKWSAALASDDDVCIYGDNFAHIGKQIAKKAITQNVGE